MSTELGLDQIQRGHRLMLLESGLVSAMTASVTGLFLTGLVIELGGQAQHVAWLEAALVVGGAFQVGTNWILTRLGSRKHFCLIALGTVRFLWAGIALTPCLVVLGIDRTLLLAPIGILMLVIGIFGMSADVVCQSWIADLVPVSVRGRFFGRRLQIAGGVMMIAIPAYAWFIDAWQASGHESLRAFQIVIGFGVGAGFASLWCIWCVPEPTLHRDQAPTSLLESLRLPFREQQYRWFMVLHGSFNFAAGMCGGFFHFFMLSYLGMSYLMIAATDFVSQLVGLALAPFWGTFADRWGTKRLLTWALVAKAIFPFLWLTLLPQWWYLVFAVVLVRVFNTAQAIGFTNLGLQLAPRADRAAYISVDRSCNNLVQAGAPALAGGLVAIIGDRVWILGSVPFTALHLLILLSGLLRLASLVFLRKIREPEVRDLGPAGLNANDNAPRN